jgi:hypothetical protein
MARVVVLHFDDNDAAEHFVEGVLALQDPNTELRSLPALIRHTGSIVAACGKVEAIIARPTVYCKCKIVGMTEWSRQQNRRKNSNKFVDYSNQADYATAMGQHRKTERYGWLIHTKCKKPNRFIVQRFIQNLLIGLGCNNLLSELKEAIRQERIANYIAPPIERNEDGTRITATPADGNGPADTGSSQLVSDGSSSSVLLPEVLGQIGG